MKPDAPSRRPEETELKLALLHTGNPSHLEKRLARVPVLARRKATHQHLHNVYYDTPQRTLQRQRIALRMRHLSGEARPRWVQTLKIGGASDSALSRRGEWEAAVPGSSLSQAALQTTPWSAIDPDGAVFQALAPVFITTFDRTSWLVRKRDGSQVEVSLDVGKITYADTSTPICELELELMAGQPQALFDVALQIASSIATLPLGASKAERGYALAQDLAHAPTPAQPPALTARMPLQQAALQVLREPVNQFTRNLNTLYGSENPEVLHQARIGWRRFRTALWLFKSVHPGTAMPALQALRPLLTFMGELRDLDVARTETLLPWQQPYTAGDPRRTEKWQALEQALQQAAQLQRKAVRYALEQPAVGATLLALTQWLEDVAALETPAAPEKIRKKHLQHWARRRMKRLHEQLQQALADEGRPDSQHRVRLLAKRVRYGVEALRPLLPPRTSRRWHQQAVKLQTRIGTARDRQRAAAVVSTLDVDRELMGFVRGWAAAVPDRHSSQ